MQVRRTVITAPHGAQIIELMEDHENPGMRIYMLREPGTTNEIGLTGEEFNFLSKVWLSELTRQVLHKDLLIPN